MLGVDKSYTNFDDDIIIDINSVLMILCQLGLGPAEGFLIVNNGSTWDDFLGSSPNLLVLAKTYTYLKVKLMFDPPTSSAVIESINQQIKEYEWRLNIQAESGGITT
jgi:hypothetical protein